MDHIDVLWEIASETEIIEASKFDRVMHKKVPEKLKSQIEPEDLEEGDPAELSELWEDFDDIIQRNYGRQSSLQSTSGLKILR